MIVDLVIHLIQACIYEIKALLHLCINRVKPLENEVYIVVVCPRQANENSNSIIDITYLPDSFILKLLRVRGGLL